MANFPFKLIIPFVVHWIGNNRLFTQPSHFSNYPFSFWETCPFSIKTEAERKQKYWQLEWAWSPFSHDITGCLAISMELTKTNHLHKYIKRFISLVLNGWTDFVQVLYILYVFVQLPQIFSFNTDFTIAIPLSIFYFRITLLSHITRYKYLILFECWHRWRDYCLWN